MKKSSHFAVGADGNRRLTHIKFSNGYTLSMNIGYSGYNDNRNIRQHPVHEIIESGTVECAVFDSNGEWVTRQFFPKAEQGELSVAGWATILDVENAIKSILAISQREAEIYG
jgi:hypothetical protein